MKTSVVYFGYGLRIPGQNLYIYTVHSQQMPEIGRVKGWRSRNELAEIVVDGVGFATADGLHGC